MQTLRKLLAFHLGIVLFTPVISQVNNGTYEAAKISNGQIQADIIQINTYALGNYITLFTTGKDYKTIDGCYHLSIHGQRKYAVGNFTKGLPDGEWTEYLYGTIYRTANYKKGKLEGKVTTYNSNGSISRLETYKDGIIQYYILYFDDGKQIKEESHYDENGYRQGEVVTFNQEGQVIEKKNYLHGKYHGENITINEKGQEVQVYEKGLFIGEYLLYPNGNKKQEGNYDKNKKRTGQWSYWYENGDLKEIENYEDGKLEGEKRTYYTGGVIKSLATYKQGEYHGKNIRYDENPNIPVSEAMYNNGKLDGEFKAYNGGKIWRESFYKEGTLIREKEYINGKLNKLRLIDDNGTLVDVQHYDTSGKLTYKNQQYRRPSSIVLKEDASGIIDIE